MDTYYEKIVKLWKAGQFFDAISLFNQWSSEGLLTQEEIENLNKGLVKLWESVEAECVENPKVTFNLYEMVKKTRNWDDQRLCRELNISEEAIEDIKAFRRPTSETVGLRLLYELFPQMAV